MGKSDGKNPTPAANTPVDPLKDRCEGLIWGWIDFCTSPVDFEITTVSPAMVTALAFPEETSNVSDK
jgi:hypothetical protein